MGLVGSEMCIRDSAIIIPPALWATGGFGLAFQHPSLNSFIQSFILYLRRGLALLPPPPLGSKPWCQIHPYLLNPTFSPSWSSSFFHHFSNPLLYRFLLHFESQLGAKIAPKSMKNPSQEWSGKLPTFFIDFSLHFAGFGTPQNLKSRAPVSTGSYFLRFGLSPLISILNQFPAPFFMDFGTIFVLKSLQYGL